MAANNDGLLFNIDLKVQDAGIKATKDALAEAASLMDQLEGKAGGLTQVLEKIGAAVTNGLGASLDAVLGKVSALTSALTGIKSPSLTTGQPQGVQAGPSSVPSLPEVYRKQTEGAGKGHYRPVSEPETTGKYYVDVEGKKTEKSYLDILKEHANKVGFGLARGGIAGPNLPDSPLPQGTDTKLAMVTPGEEIIPVHQANQHRELLEAIRSGKLDHYATGGTVLGSTGSPITRQPPDTEDFGAELAKFIPPSIGEVVSKVTNTLDNLADTLDLSGGDVAAFGAKIKDGFEKGGAKALAAGQDAVKVITDLFGEIQKAPAGLNAVAKSVIRSTTDNLKQLAEDLSPGAGAGLVNKVGTPQPPPVKTKDEVEVEARLKRITDYQKTITDELTKQTLKLDKIRASLDPEILKKRVDLEKEETTLLKQYNEALENARREAGLLVDELEEATDVGPQQSGIDTLLDSFKQTTALFKVPGAALADQVKGYVEQFKGIQSLFQSLTGLGKKVPGSVSPIIGSIPASPVPPSVSGAAGAGGTEAAGAAGAAGGAGLAAAGAGVGIAIAAVVGPFVALKGALDGLTSAASAVTGAISGIGDSVAPFVAKFNPAIIERWSLKMDDLFASLGRIFEPLIDASSQVADIFNEVFTVAGGPLRDAIQSLSGVVVQAGSALATALVPILSGLAPLLDSVSKLLGDWIGALRPLLTSMGESFGKTLAAMAPLVDILSAALVPIIRVLSDVLGAAIRVLSPITDVIGGIFKVLAPAFESLMAPVNMLAGLFEALAPLLDLLSIPLNMLSYILSELGDSFKSLVHDSLAILAPALKGLGDTVKGLMNFLRSIPGIGRFISGSPAAPTGQGAHTFSAQTASIQGLEQYAQSLQEAAYGATSPGMMMVEQQRTSNQLLEQIVGNTAGRGGSSSGALGAAASAAPFLLAGIPGGFGFMASSALSGIQRAVEGWTSSPGGD